MTNRQSLEASAIREQLNPMDGEDGVRCLGTDALIRKFSEHLQAQDIPAELVFGGMAADKATFSEVRLRVSLPYALEIVNEFSIYLATQPEVDIAAYLGGVVPNPEALK